MTQMDQTGKDAISNETTTRAADNVARGRPGLVRPLEWREGDGQLAGQKVWSSGDPWVFWIVKNPGAKFIWCENFNIEGWCPASPVRGSFETLDEAKAAAQADFDQRILAALVRPPAAAVRAQRSQGPISFFSENVDAWGAAEWFDRLAKAIRQQDEAVVAKNDLLFETCRNVAASSAMRLVRDYEQQVRDALAAAARCPAAEGASEELLKLISDIEAERIGLVTWVRGGYVPLDADTLLSALRSAAEFRSSAGSAGPVARAHITLEDDGPYAKLEVLNGEALQPSMSPVDLYTAPVGWSMTPMGRPIYTPPAASHSPAGLDCQPDLTATCTKLLPGGKLDDSTFSQVEDALDAVDAPMTDNGRYMTLVERIAAYGKEVAQLRAQASNVQECFAKIAEDAAKRWVNGEASTRYGQAYQAACRYVAEAIRSHKLAPTERS